jgi:hypothetical protein
LRDEQIAVIRLARGRGLGQPVGENPGSCHIETGRPGTVPSPYSFDVERGRLEIAVCGIIRRRGLRLARK